VFPFIPSEVKKTGNISKNFSILERIHRDYHGTCTSNMRFWVDGYKWSSFPGTLVFLKSLFAVYKTVVDECMCFKRD